MHSFLNLSPLNTNLSRKVISFFDISARNLMVGWKFKAAQQTQNTSTSGSGGNPTIDHTGKKKACLYSWGLHYSTRPGLETINE